MTTTTLEHCGARIELKDATEHELADAFGTDDDMDAQILAELKRRDDRADREQARIRALRTDPDVSAWTDAAHAQLLQAEAACAGNLVRRDSHVTDAWSLWSGPHALGNGPRQRGTTQLLGQARARPDSDRVPRRDAPRTPDQR